MSTSIPTVNPPSLLSSQPFQCRICQSRFTRHENLKRHTTVHSRSANKASLPCEVCQITFSRPDLQKRHMKRKHPDEVESRSETVKRAQPDPGVGRLWRDGSGSSPELSYELQPSRNGAEMEIDSWVGGMGLPRTAQQQLDHVDQSDHPDLSCTLYSSTRAPNFLVNHSIGIASSERDTTQFDQNLLLESLTVNSTISHEFSNEMQTPQPIFAEISSNGGSSPRPYMPDGLSSNEIPYLQDDWFPSPSQTARGYQLYFTHISHFVPFIHRPTFDATETPRHLGLSMLSLAYQHSEDPDSREQPGSGALLSQRCFHRARVLAASEEEISSDLLHKITLVQTYWLLQVCVMMYMCGEASVYGLKIHSTMISLARFGGLTQALQIETTTTEDLEDLEDLWLDFIRAESHKRTLLAVHQIDALWYQLFSIPRALSHLEIKHDLPCQEAYWTASSSAQWAHRQLAAKKSAPLVPYSEAVRCFLSPGLDIETLPTFDLYGAINIVQFLLSSAREVSGWSTMTGRLSLERFEPIRSSLFALKRLIRPQDKTVNSTHAISCEATWEMAMIELLIWSPSHTSGIVGGSVDSFLSQSTYLALSSKMLNERTTNSAVQPHINWFLCYLNNATGTENSEPPWIALYAYKAFLIAWQLLQEGIPGAMQVVGVQDGDFSAAVRWARGVFRRSQWGKIPVLIRACLDILDP